MEAKSKGQGIIAVLPCNGISPAGRLTRIATQELVLEGKVIWLSSEILAGNTDCKPLLLEGCTRKCLARTIPADEISSYHRLALPDIGIEPETFSDITRDDITLAKDAVIAEGTDVSGMFQPHFPGCCCR